MMRRGKIVGLFQETSLVYLVILDEKTKICTEGTKIKLSENLICVHFSEGRERLVPCKTLEIDTYSDN